MPSKREFALGGIVLGLVAAAVLVGKLEGARASGYARQAEDAIAVAKDTQAKALKLAVEKSELATENARLERVVAELKTRRIPVPPEPGPAPVDEAALQRGLLDRGWKPGLVVHSDPFKPSLLAHSDAALAWETGEQAKTVPVLRERIKSDGEIIDGQDKLISGLRAENAKADEIKANLTEAMDHWKQAEESREKEAKALIREVKIERFKTRVAIGIGVAAVVYARKH